MMILGIFGPWQVIAILVVLLLLFGGLIRLIVSRAKNKTKAEMLEKQLQYMKDKEKSA